MDRPTPEHLGSLVTSITGLAGTVTKLSAEIAEEKEARETSEFWSRLAIGAAVLVGVVGVVIGVLGVLAAGESQQSVDSQAKSRAENRVAACVQDNVRIDQHNKLTEAVRQILLAADVPRPDPAQQAAARVYFDKAYAELDKTIVPIRDCTPAGIDAYLTPPTSEESNGSSG